MYVFFWHVKYATEPGAFAAAICTGIGIGLFKDCKEAVNKCDKVKKYLNQTRRLFLNIENI